MVTPDCRGRYEEEYLADMDALGVRRPDVMPRVSDYIPQIVAYIARIQRNGLAYERDGSVYFDTAAFECALGPLIYHFRWQHMHVSRLAQRRDGCAVCLP